MKTDEINKIINEYGKVLELTSSYSCSAESFLPYPKDKIKAAILVAYPFADEKIKNHLSVAYVSLANFLPNDDAIIVQRYEKWLREQAKRIENPKQEQIDISVHSKDARLGEKHLEILQKISKESKKLLNEFQKFEKSLQQEVDK